MLRPSELNLTGIRRSIKQHASVLANNLYRLYKLRSRHAEVAEICLKIMNCANGDRIDMPAFEQRLSITEINEIRRNFGECMTPIWAMRGMIPGVKAHDDCFFESNNRFWDIKVYQGQEVTLVSNKALSKYSNLMTSVVREINVNTDYYFKWNNKVPYRVLETLEDSTALAGPIKAIMRFYPSVVKASQNDLNNVMRQLTQSNAILENVPESIMQLIDDNDVARQKYEEKEEVTATMINFIFEKILIQQSVNDPLYNELFIDANNRNVHVLKFDFDSSGKVSYKLQAPKNTTSAVFRSKNDVGRCVDRMALTIP
jgi:hypothetical protein